MGDGDLSNAVFNLHMLIAWRSHVSDVNTGVNLFDHTATVRQRSSTVYAVKCSEDCTLLTLNTPHQTGCTT